MENYDRQLMEWINQRLGIMHSAVTRDEAKMWQRLLMADRQQFDAHAIYGFCRRRQRDRQQKNFPGDEIVLFLNEFIFKLQLVSKSRKVPFDLPLFDVVGKESLEKLGLVPNK